MENKAKGGREKEWRTRRKKRDTCMQCTLQQVNDERGRFYTKRGRGRGDIGPGTRMRGLLGSVLSP